MRDGRRCGDVQHVHARVADGFPIQGASTRCDGAPEVLRIVWINECSLDPQPPEAHVELGISAAVECLRGDNLIPRFEQAHERDELRSLSAPHCQRPHAALEGRHALLEHGGGRVHDARVDVAKALQVEQSRGVRRVKKTLALDVVPKL
jgi:hypothetical protein